MNASVIEEALVWSTRTGWDLLGRPVNVYLTWEGLGFTHPAAYGEPVNVFINPEVLQRANGLELFQALILHELGHHAYHFGDPDFNQVSLRLKRDGLRDLLNLVMDEHMERRLRSRSSVWGEALDALASYAFKETDCDFFMADYAALLGYPDHQSAIDVVLSGQAPGKIKEKEHGYRLEGRDGRWVSFHEFLQMLRECLQEAFGEDVLPANIEKLFDQLADESIKEMPTKHNGLLLALRQTSIFSSDGRIQGNSSARMSLSALIARVEESAGTPREYVSLLREILTPYFEYFPGIERFIVEMERSQDSIWFEAKRNSMLHNMRSGYDFNHTFHVEEPGTLEKVNKLLQKSNMKLFDPVSILEELIEETRPVPARHPKRPALMALSWSEMLAGPATPSMVRFMVSLRLGLGHQFMGKDSKAIEAMKAVPRRLRKLGMDGLGELTEKLAHILKLESEEPEGQDSTGADQGSKGKKSAGAGAEGQGSSDAGQGRMKPDSSGAGSVGEVICRKIQQTQSRLGAPPPPNSVSAERIGEMKSAAGAAARRIEHWLKTGTDPGEKKPGTDKRRRFKLPRGARPTGVDRIQHPLRSSGAESDPREKPVRDLLNLADTLDFDRIDKVLAPPANPAAYKALAVQVRPQTRHLRRYLAQLGEAEVEQPAHRLGRRLDPGRLKRLAVFNQPDVMIGLERRPAPDLFIGICVDCSGSMSFEDRMDKAQQFAVLLLEACRGLPGIDCRALGFNDDELFDLGGPGITRVAGLEPGGGNNDAAGLLAIAQHALASRKEHRLLIMISDGYPTECSHESLSQLVKVLKERFRLQCAQVAVAEMDAERIAFPHFTDLTRCDARAATHAFGRMVRRLLQQQFT